MANSLISPLLVRLYLVLCLLVQAKSVLIIEKEPSSLLIPANEIDVFSCQARCHCNGYWIVNGTRHHSINTRRMISNYTESSGTLTLTVNASEAMNNTSIQCDYEENGIRTGYNYSKIVYLLVISNSPILPNPSLMNNASHFTLTWSPPFLWPGRRIQYYNISVTKFNKIDGSMKHHRVDTSFSDSLVAFSVHSLNTLNMLSCVGIVFSISAIDGSSSEQMQTFNISDWLWIFPSALEFTASAINTSVLFNADRTPALVEVYIQLPRSNCSYEKLNYTLILENEQEDTVAEVGTFLLLDSGIVKESITSNLKENHNYSLRLRVDAQSQLASSQKHLFNTHLQSCNTCSASKVTIARNNSILPYMALTVIFAVLTLLLFMALLAVVVCLCIGHRKRIIEMKFNESKNRVCNVMVHNPIYDGDGPVYESVQAQFETTESKPQSIDATDRQYDNLRQSFSDTARYVNPPDQLQYLYATSTSFEVNNSAIAPLSRFTSVSMPPATSRVIALKRNSQERNKLHLMLSLDGNDSFNNSNGEVAPKPVPKTSAVASATMEETYTVMSPAGVPCHSLNSGKVEPISSV